jgi:DNA-binding NarL/FixJ family response regulator
MKPPQPDGELCILVGGFLEECIGEIIAKVVEHSLGYARVNVRIVEALPALLQAAAHSPPDLFLLYLYFGAPADEAVTDPATSGTEIHDFMAQSTADQPCYVTSCGLRLVTHLRAEFGKPVIVLTGCGNQSGRATRVEQAGGSALLLLPFTVAECAAAVGSCVERQPEPDR